MERGAEGGPAGARRTVRFPGDRRQVIVEDAGNPAPCDDPAVVDQNNAGLKGDCRALLAAEAALVGSGTALNWGNDRVRLGRWDGVTVSSLPARATRLYLPNHGLAGALPSALGSLGSLRDLHLSDNRLSGAIPSELGNLRNLKWLYLHNNQLSGCVPRSLRALYDPRGTWSINPQDSEPD